MTIHELIQILQSVPNQNLEVWSNDIEGEYPVQDITVADGKLFVDDDWHGNDAIMLSVEDGNIKRR